MITVLCGGCFDVLHVGHVRHLKEAREMGDKLVVALTLDEFVNKGPGRPIHNWKDRAEVLMELGCVDEVVSTRNCGEAILRVRPDLFVKGCDYNPASLAEWDVHSCNAVGAQIRFTTSDKMSSAEIIKKVTSLCVS